MWKENSNFNEDSSDFYSVGPINNANIYWQPLNPLNVVEPTSATVNQIGGFQPEKAEETFMTLLEPADSSFRQQSFESQRHVTPVPDTYREAVIEDSLQSQYLQPFVYQSDGMTVYTDADNTTVNQPANSEPENLLSISCSSSGISRANGVPASQGNSDSDTGNKPGMKSSGRRTKEKADKQEPQQKKKRQRKKKQLPKDSPEYLMSRARNNVSVNKTREKKRREKELLIKERDQLRSERDSLITERDYYKSRLIEHRIPF